MIEILNLVDDTKKNTGLWCSVTDDDVALAQMAGAVLESNMGILSVAPGVIKTVWPWMEGRWVKIFGRFYFSSASKVTEDDVSELVKNIKAGFKNGASGAQIFVPVKLLDTFVNELYAVRDDLFFNKDLSIGLDISEIGADMWGYVFECLMKIRADSVVFVLSHDLGNKSDFVGRVYAMLNAWTDAYSGDVCWMQNGNFYRFEQVVRLTRRMRPDLMARTVLLIRQ